MTALATFALVALAAPSAQASIPSDLPIMPTGEYCDAQLREGAGGRIPFEDVRGERNVYLCRGAADPGVDCRRVQLDAEAWACVRT